MNGRSRRFGARLSQAARMAAEDFGCRQGQAYRGYLGDQPDNLNLAASVARRWLDVEQVDVIADLSS